MSVSTGTPSSRLTESRIASPSCNPGPRKVELLERLALSKLALKMYCRPSLSQIDFTREPTVRQSSRDSITHGPAMMKSGDIGFRVQGSGFRVQIGILFLNPEPFKER